MYHVPATGSPIFKDRAASEMTYIVSGGALNSTHSLQGSRAGRRYDLLAYGCHWAAGDGRGAPSEPPSPTACSPFYQNVVDV